MGLVLRRGQLLRTPHFKAMRVTAIDWSGRLTGDSEFIWIAEVENDRLVSLESGRGRREVIEYLLAGAREDPRVVIGFDFAFSFPAWWCAERGWRSAREAWEAMADEGEDLLRECRPPFWGRPGITNPHPSDRRYRRTEIHDADGAKSVFQIGGAGAVGTGSVRGMAHLGTLTDAGFDIWPFGPAGWPRVIEIYPRALSGPVTKRRWRARHEFLFERYAAQPQALLERAAGSEDAFDAALSALVMGQHVKGLQELSPSADPTTQLEGRIWRPDQ